MDEKETAPAPLFGEPVPEQEKISKNTLVLAGAILLGSLIVAGAVTSAKVPVAGRDSGTGAGAEEPAPETDTSATTQIDDDPTLGNRAEARVAIVEFSDYECPFCKRFHDDSYAALIRDYVDTGKATYTFRDYPLSFHEPNASLAAGLATCIQKSRGDQAYFNFAQAYFAATESNGKGMSKEALDTLIRNAGGAPAAIRSCAETQEIKDEIAKDMADGTEAGISGTPSFVIGTVSEDGTVTGERVVGALPLAGFQAVIDKYLAE